MYIRGLIPQNSTGLAEEIPIVTEMIYKSLLYIYTSLLEGMVALGAKCNA